MTMNRNTTNLSNSIYSEGSNKVPAKTFKYELRQACRSWQEYTAVTYSGCYLDRHSALCTMNDCQNKSKTLRTAPIPGYGNRAYAIFTDAPEES